MALAANLRKGVKTAIIAERGVLWVKGHGNKIEGKIMVTAQGWEFYGLSEEAGEWEM
jgi:hypothetical protein